MCLSILQTCAPPRSQAQRAVLRRAGGRPHPGGHCAGAAAPLLVRCCQQDEQPVAVACCEVADGARAANGGARGVVLHPKTTGRGT